jgi:hypothetical protein
MSDINTFQQQLIEKLFQMERGYVLDFSNSTIANFFYKELEIDIYDEKYNMNGDSKANRLREFFSVENNNIAGIAINKLIEYIETKIIIDDFAEGKFSQKLISAVKEIATELINKTTSVKEKEVSKYHDSNIFEANSFGLFISHRDNNKEQAQETKELLSVYGISGFVAHDDIEPSKEWQGEIELALFSMDSLIALLYEGFFDSSWTNQEIGVAFGLKKPIFTVRLGEDPKGFVGKFQALRPSNGSSEDLALQIATQIIKNSATKEVMINAYFYALGSCISFNECEIWAQLLPHISVVDLDQINILINAFNENSQARDCYAINGGRYRNQKDIATYINDWINDEKYIIKRRKICNKV